MNDAEREPSPSRFCSRLGIRRAAAKASAAGPRPSTALSNDSRARPAMRDRAIPAATAEEPLPSGRFDRSSVSGSINATVPAAGPGGPTPRRHWVACAHVRDTDPDTRTGSTCQLCSADPGSDADRPEGRGSPVCSGSPGSRYGRDPGGQRRGCGAWRSRRHGPRHPGSASTGPWPDRRHGIGSQAGGGPRRPRGPRGGRMDPPQRAGDHPGPGPTRCRGDHLREQTQRDERCLRSLP